MVMVIYFTVVASYRQNVHAYPSGGGDYEVVAHNLGPNWGVFVASALLIDYVLTVAVSISPQSPTSGRSSPSSSAQRVVRGRLIVVITLLNLRGVEESGAFFAIPVYFFISSIFAMIGWAVFEMFILGETLLAESAAWEIVAENAFTGAACLPRRPRLLLRHDGAHRHRGRRQRGSGLPGAEVQERRDDAAAAWPDLMTMFAGITWLALKTEVKVTEFTKDLIGLPEGESQKTVIVQIADAVFHHSWIPVLVIALATATILALAANTAFNGFPVIGSVLARDGYLPRQFHTRGDRLAFSNGILTLAGLAIILVIVYQADVSGLIQLYIIGVFTSFTLSQLGMVRHWNRHLKDEESPEERRRMLRSRLINGSGCR